MNLTKTLDDIKFKINNIYNENEMYRFGFIYKELYDKLYQYFYDEWLKYCIYHFIPSDDGYSDLISSMIGKGKKKLIECIKDINNFVKMAKDENYKETSVTYFKNEKI